MPKLAIVSLCLLSIVSLSVAEIAQSLKSYNVDLPETSVSGISSGGNFAVQMQVAFSSIIKGAGIVAGGPYNCAAEHLLLYCMTMANVFSTTGVSRAKEWSGTKIDDTAHMRRQRVYILSGTLDTVVSRSVVNQLYDFYVTKGHLIEPENVLYNTKLISGHTFPTDFTSLGNNVCTMSHSPFISNCGFDGAGAILQHIYGNLSPRNPHPSGQYIKFKQSEFAPDIHKIGLADEGYAYVPQSCASGAKCRLHLAFHGCGQSAANVGTKFITNTGYDQWADSNHLIVLFPQTRVDYSLHLTAMNGFLNNANACWDWMGFYGSNFATKEGAQMSTIRKMIDRIAGHH